ncbi:hypothetical protein HDU76_005143, partial [Blyttiomyces sp. JEL0837]
MASPRTSGATYIYVNPASLSQSSEVNEAAPLIIRSAGVPSRLRKRFFIQRPDDGDDYQYPQHSDLKKEKEFSFETPVKCSPFEASYPQYFEGRFLFNRDTSDLKLKFDGVTHGDLLITVDSSMPVGTKPYLEFHTHASSKSLSVHIRDTQNDRSNVQLDVLGPSSLGFGECLMVAARLVIPADSFNSTKISVEAKALSVNADLSSKVKLASLDVATGDGKINIEHLETFDKLRVSTESGGISIKSGKSSVIDLYTRQGLVVVEDVFTENVLRIENGRGSVKGKNIVSDGQLFVSSTFGSVIMKTVTGDFDWLIAKAHFFGNVMLQDVDMPIGKPVKVAAQADTGSCELKLRDFNGTFQIESAMGDIGIDGGGVKLTKDRPLQKFGTTGRGDHTLTAKSSALGSVK